MEEFPEEKKKYTYENPCPRCGFPVEIKKHDPNWCENAKEDLETKEKEETGIIPETQEELLARGKAYMDYMDWLKEVEKQEKKQVAAEPKKPKVEKPIEKKKEIPEKLEEVIFILADKITRKVSAAAGGLEAKEVKGERERKWITESFLPRLIKEQEEKRDIRIPADWVIILNELESRVPPAAKEFVRKYREEYEQKLRNAGVF